MKRMFIAGVAMLAAAGLSTAANAQGTVKIGVIAAYSGQFADTANQIDNGIKLYMKQHGDTVAGKKIEIVLGMHPKQGLARGRLYPGALIDVRGKPARQHLIGYRVQARRALRVPRPHVVQSARRVCNIQCLHKANYVHRLAFIATRSCWQSDRRLRFPVRARPAGPGHRDSSDNTGANAGESGRESTAGRGRRSTAGFRAEVPGHPQGGNATLRRRARPNAQFAGTGRDGTSGRCTL